MQQLNTRGYGHDGVMLAYHGREPVGYCWTAEMHQSEPEEGAVVGRIHMMGVTPEFRGRGCGRHVLSSGLKHLADKGIRTVALTVDNENKAACTLYEKAGFTPKTTLLWYEKKMR
jgi:mycothiol synthase